MPTRQTAGKRITSVPRLRPSTPQALPFAPALEARAFLLERPDGNLLIYSTTALGGDADAAMLEDLGRIARRYLNHWHEAMFDPGSLSAPLFVHAADRAAVEERGIHVHGSFARRHFLDADFEVIPTPGHTPGATAYLWETGGRRLLFTGDTIYLDDGEWVAALLGSSDRSSYIASLELLRGLEFDVLVPWAATAGQPFLAFTDPADARVRIDAIADRLRRGEDR